MTVGADLSAAQPALEGRTGRVPEPGAAPSDARFRALFEQGSQFAGILHLDGTLVEANRLCLDACGFSRAEVIGRPFWDCGWWSLSSSLAEMVREGCRQAASGRVFRREERYFVADGSRRWTDLILSPVTDDAGRVLFIAATGTDITEKKQAEARDQLLVAIDDAIRPMTDPHEITQAAARLLGTHLGANRCAYADVEADQDTFNLTGDYNDGVESIVGRYTFTQFGAETLRLMREGRPYVVSDSEADPRTEEVRQAYRSTKIRAVVCVSLLKEGRFVGAMAVHQATVRAWEAAEVELVQRVLARCWESMERARAERVLRKSEERFRQIAESVDAVFYVSDLPERRVQYVSPAYERLWGLNPDELLKDRELWLQRIHPEEREWVKREFRGFLAGERAYDVEYRIRLESGEERWVRDRATTAARGVDGTIYRVTGIAEDVTRRHHSDQRLRDSEERFRTAVGVVSSLIWTNNAEGQMVGEQPGWGGFTGQSREEYSGHGWAAALHPDDAAPTVEAWNLAVAEKKMFVFEHRVRRFDGEWRLFSVRAAPVLTPGGRIREWVGVHTDITDRRRHEEALRESEDRFRNMADHSPVMMWVTRPDGLCVYLNRAWYEFTGQSAGEAEGLGWLQAVHPEDADSAKAAYLRANAGHKSFRVTYRLRRRDGVCRWAIDAAAPRFGPDGVFLGYIGSVTDVTDLEEARRLVEEHNARLEHEVRLRTEELAASHERLRSSERMASLGTLSAGLGHDMGNLLMPIRVRLESLGEAELSETAREDVRAIRTAAEYLQRLANGLRLLSLDPSRSPTGEATNMASWWSDAQGVLKSVLPRGILLEMREPAERIDLAISRAALTQVVFNLVQNAGDAMRDRRVGRICIGASREDNWVVVTVSDDGPGMTAEVKARCMEPFFTTKARAISTGLGLTLVYGIVRDAQGRVDFDSQPGRGTTFTIRVPRAVEGDAISRGTGPPVGAVVELADARMRSIVLGELRSLGFEVGGVEASKGKKTVYVLDDASGVAGLPEGVPVVLLCEDSRTTRPGVCALGNRPGVGRIRAVLRELVRAAHAPEADSGRQHPSS